MTFVAVLISCSALAFTIGSFYWLQARKGRLKLLPVVTFSASASKELFLLRLPITTYNSGARPRVLRALRLRLRGEGYSHVLLECHTFRKTIDPTPDDMEDFAHPYVVRGRDVATKFAHFRGQTVRALLEGGDKARQFDLEALVDGQEKWVRLGIVDVHTEIIHTGSYISYSNNAGVWPDDLMTMAAAHRDSLEPFRQA